MEDKLCSGPVPHQMAADQNFCPICGAAAKVVVPIEERLGHLEATVAAQALQITSLQTALNQTPTVKQMNEAIEEAVRVARTPDQGDDETFFAKLRTNLNRLDAGVANFLRNR